MDIKLTDTYQALVAHFGSQQLAAAALSISQPSVNAWVTGKANMSPIVALRAEKATGGLFKAADLCPAFKQIEQHAEVSHGD